MESPRTATARRRPAAAFVCLLALLSAFASDVFGLKGVRIWNPEAIRAGESLRLKCDYDLEGVPLYSIRWYFGDQEFYRFVPKESPPTRVFPLSGDSSSVDISDSDDHSVMLTNLPRDMSGHYKCEVSADAPLFHTEIKESYITIIKEPQSQPLMFAGKLKYSKDDKVKINCTSYSAFPASNLTWFINDKKVTNSTKHVNITSWVVNETDGLLTSRSRLELTDRLAYFFPGGRMTVRCESDQFQLYKKYSVIELTDDSPRLAQMISPTSVLRTGPQANGADRSVTRTAFVLAALLAIRIASR